MAITSRVSVDECNLSAATPLPANLVTLLSADYDTINVNKMSKGAVTIAHNAITATATSAEIDCRGGNAVHLEFEISGSGVWDLEVVGSAVSGGTFSNQYVGGLKLERLGLSANAGFVVPIGANYIKIVATEISGTAAVTVRVTPMITTAPIAKKQWDIASVILAATNGYGGAVADLAADGAYDYTNAVDLVSGDDRGLVGTLEYDSAGTTDNIIISAFGSIDGTNFDDTPLWSMTCDATSGTDTQISFTIKDYPYTKFGVKTTGTTDTFDYRITYRPFK